MTDVSLNPITSGYNTSKLNSNFTTIQDSINSDLINRTGGNNIMDQDLDLNSNNLLNVAEIDASIIKLDGGVLNTSPFVISAAYDATLAKKADLASTATGKGGSLVGFLQAGAGAFAQTIQDKAQNSVSILDYIPPTERAAIFAGTSTYDCLPALTAALASFSANASANYAGVPIIDFPYGKLYFSNTIELKKVVILRGNGNGMPGLDTTILQFPANTIGVIIHRYNTIGSGVQSPTTTGADGTIIQGISIQGPSSGSTSGHGIWMRARAKIVNCKISNFAENGIHIAASAGTGGSTEGNANGWMLDTVRVSGCNGHGVYVSGADTNSGTGLAINVAGCGKSGICDSSFLGNTWIGCQIATSTFRGQVNYGGNRYYTINEALAGSTTPGTDPAVWVLIGAGGVHALYPTWVSGNTYYESYVYRATSNNAGNVFIGCYTEGSQVPSEMAAPAICIGASVGGFTQASTGFVIGSSTTTGKITKFTVASDKSSSNAFGTGYCIAPDEVSRVTAVGDTGNGFQPLMWDNTNGGWKSAWGRGGAIVYYTTALNLVTGGRSAPIAGGSVMFPKGYWLGNSTTTCRYHGANNAAPTAGEWAKGDIIWNSNPAAGGFAGWICTTGGTPGTWKTFGTISA